MKDGICQNSNSKPDHWSFSVLLPSQKGPWPRVPRESFSTRRFDSRRAPAMSEACSWATEFTHDRLALHAHLHKPTNYCHWRFCCWRTGRVPGGFFLDMVASNWPPSQKSVSSQLDSCQIIGGRANQLPTPPTNRPSSVPRGSLSVAEALPVPGTSPRGCPPPSRAPPLGSRTAGRPRPPPAGPPPSCPPRPSPGARPPMAPGSPVCAAAC